MASDKPEQRHSDHATLTVGETLSATVPPIPRTHIKAPRLVARDAYTWGDEIGRGGMGVVYQAFDRNLGRSVAIKELLGTHASARLRFEREMRITARLQHPGIVPIYEAGNWSSDELFYAMKMVSGETLAAAIAARATLAERMSLLANVLAVAEAVAYAHKENIIHRDLKPANVILGEYGETVVIDWGLGKDLSDSESANFALGSDVEAPDLTVEGSAVGTPAYMAPEQALGQVVDKRADVYALGAMLYHVLSGARPYRELSGPALLEQIRRHPPSPIASIAPEVPADLCAIVTRAMQWDPALRYQNARELADDLRRYEDGQRVAAHTYTLAALFRRWVRRHRTSVTVAAVLLVALVTTGILGIQGVVSARNRARDQRAAAEELVQFMLGDMQSRLEPVGKLDLLIDVGDKVERYYTALSVSSDVDDVAAERRAQSLRLVGWIALNRGELDRADRALAQAETTARALAARSGVPPVILATTLAIRGALEKTRGNQERARAANEESRALEEKHVAANPADKDAQRRLAYVLRNLGDVDHVGGNLEAAYSNFKRSLEISQAVDGASTDPVMRNLLCASHGKLGEVAFRRGDIEAGLANHRACLKIAREILAKDPGDSVFLRRAYESEFMVGQMLMQRLDTVGAGDAFQRGLDLAETLFRRDPSNRNVQHMIAELLGLLGQVEMVRLNLGAATTYATRRCAVADELQQAVPAAVDFMRAAMACRFQLGEIAFAKPDLVAAREAFTDAYKMAERLSAAQPNKLPPLRDLVVIRMLLGDAALRAKDFATSTKELTAALAIAEQLVAKDPSNGLWASDLGTCHRKLGDSALAQGDPRAARDHFQRSLEQRLKMSATDATNMQWKVEVADSYTGIAQAARALRDIPAAIAAYRSRLATELSITRPADDKVGAARIAMMRLELALQLAATAASRSEARTLLEQAVPVVDQNEKDKTLSPEEARQAAEARALLRKLGASRP